MLRAMTRPRAALVSLATTLLLAPRVLADVSARLVYVRDAPAAATCPDETALRRAVEARLGYDPFLPWGSTAVVVRFAREGQGFVANVEMVTGGASRGVRTLRSDDPNCGGLVDAAALAVSIALDAQRAPAPPAPPASVPPDGTSPAWQGRGQDQTEGGSPLPPSNPVDASPSPSSDIEPSPLPPPAAARMRFRPVVGLDALVSVGSAPAVSPGLSVWGRLQADRWSLGLEARADAPSSGQELKGTVSTWLVVGGVAPCFHLGPAFGCVVGELGLLEGRGENVQSPGSGSRLFAAVGPRVGVEIPVTTWGAIRLRADFLANLAPVSVTFDGSPTAGWQPPPVTGTVGGGIAIRFP
jgi:hypothetical protein